MENVEETIRKVFADVWQAQVGGAAPELKNSDLLLETGLDSLGFAILVSTLEEELEYDPFTLSKDAFYPQTFSEFVDFYKKYRPN